MLVLVPLSSAFLARGFLRGDRTVVGNEELLSWALTPAGLVYLLLAGGLLLVAGTIRFAGIFQIVTAEVEGERVDLRRTAVGLIPRLPSLARLSVGVVALGAVAALPLLALLGGIYLALLSAHDINYYLTVQPSEWWWAVGLGGLAAMVWGFGVLYLAGRSLLALPLYLDYEEHGGARTIRQALARSWERTWGTGGRLLRLMLVAGLGWGVTRLVVDALILGGLGLAVEWFTGTVTSLRIVVLLVFLHLAVSVAVDALIGFLGFTFLAALLTGYYYRATDLHIGSGPVLRIRAVHRRGARRLLAWLRPRRLLSLLVLLLGGSFLLSGLLLDRSLATMASPEPVLVSAHRGGPPPAPENTLAALERAIEAGADYSEVDVQLSRDGELLMVHDADFMRVAGDRRRVVEADYEALQGLVQQPDDGSAVEERRVATLGEFMDRARGRIHLMIELKYYGWDPRLARAVVDEVRRMGMEEEVLLTSLDQRALRQLAELAPELPRGYVSTVALGDPAGLPADFLAVPEGRADRTFIRNAPIPVHVWTVNEAVRMARYIDRGAAGILTDDPALAVRVREELVALPPAARILLQVRPFVLSGTAGDEDRSGHVSRPEAGGGGGGADEADLIDGVGVDLPQAPDGAVARAVQIHDGILGLGVPDRGGTAGSQPLGPEPVDHLMGIRYGAGKVLDHFQGDGPGSAGADPFPGSGAGTQEKREDQGQKSSNRRRGRSVDAAAGGWEGHGYLQGWGEETKDTGGLPGSQQASQGIRGPPSR